MHSLPLVMAHKMGYSLIPHRESSLSNQIVSKGYEEQKGKTYNLLYN